MMKITILFFATLRERAGVNRLELNFGQEVTVASLKAFLGEQFPGLKPALATCLVSVNHEFAFNPDGIPDQAEVALFPPVSGGSGFPTILRIITEPIDLNDLIQQVTLPSTGAVGIFTGVVRAITGSRDPHQTTSLEYEAYIPMAEEKMVQVAQEIRQRWSSVEGIAMVQRIGHLQPGTPTVLIACSASHRDTGVFEAARYGIDRLKEIVPVWKKEIGPNGEVWVEGKYHPQPGE
jgi:molybdopterin synthase catalytic subunit/molybdopterin converting factor small subunit